MSKLFGVFLLCVFPSLSFATTSINQSFTPATINQGDVPRFRITIYNTDTIPLTSAAVTDNLPANIVIANPAAVVNTCGFTGVTATPSSSQIILTGGTVPRHITADGDCYFELGVTSTVVANPQNIIPANGPSIAAPNTFTPGGGNSGYQATDNVGVISNATPATATLSVLSAGSPPTGSLSFSPNTVYPGDVSALTIVLTNPSGNSVNLPLTTVTDALPTGLTVAASPSSSIVCSAGGTAGAFSPLAADTTLTLTGGTIAASGGTCTMRVNLVSIATTGALTKTFTAGAIGNTRGLTSASFSGGLTVNTPIGLATSYSQSTVGPDQDSILSIDISNASSVPLTITRFTDTLPTLTSPVRAMTVGDIGANPPTIDCVSAGGGTNATFSPALASGAAAITIVNGVIGAAGSCHITVPVRGSVSTATSTSAFNNSIVTNRVINPSNYSSPSASSTLTVNPNLIVTKTSSTATVAPGIAVTYTVNIENWSGADLTSVNFADTLPLSNTSGDNQMLLSSAPTFTASGAACSTSTGSITAAAGTPSVSWNGFTINKGANANTAGICTISFKAIAPQNTPKNRTYTNKLPINALRNTVTPTIFNPTIVSASNVTISDGATITKTFSPTSVTIGTSSVLTVKIANNTGAAITNASLTDTFPSGIVVAAVPATSTTCTSGSVTATAGGGSAAISGATIAAGSNCTFKVSVTGSTTGTYTNTINIGDLTTTEGVSNGTAATKALTLTASPLGITKAFTSSSVTQGTSSILKVTLANSSSSAITGVAVSDVLPANVFIAASPSASTTCTLGTVTAVAGGGSLAISNATIPATGSCTFQAKVYSHIVASYTNTIPIGAATSTQGYTNPSAATATLTVTSFASVSKSFAPATIAQPDSSLLTVTITNGSTVAPMTGAVLTDTLPSGLVLATPPSATTTCSSGTVTAVAGANSIGISGATVPTNGSCTFSARVVGTVASGSSLKNTITPTNFNNDQGAKISSDATANITVNPGLTGTTTFTPSSVVSGATSQVSVTLTNASSGALTGVTLTDPLGTNLAVASIPNASTTCSGSPSISAAPAATSVVLSNASIPAGGSCLLLFNVTTSGTPTSWTNSIPVNNITSTEGAKNTSSISAALTKTSGDVVINKSFNPVSVSGGQSSILQIDITNPLGSSTVINNVSFNDSFPTGMIIYATPNASTTCTNGVIQATANSNSLQLSGAVIPIGTTCEVYVNVTSTKYQNLTNTIATSAVTTAQGFTNALATSATLTTLQSVGVFKSFSPASISLGQTSVLTIDVINTLDPGLANSTLHNVSFTDTLPAGVTVASTPNATTTCPSGVVASTTGSVALSGATLVANTSCTVSIDVTASTLGIYTNTIDIHALTSTESNSNPNAATAILNVVTPPTITESFTASSVKVGVASILSINIFNSNAQALNGVNLTDVLPSGLNVASTPTVTTANCGTGSVSAPAAGSNIVLSNATIAANTSCVVTVYVSSNLPSVYNNVIAASALQTTEGTTNTAPATAALTVFNPPTVAESFSPSAIDMGATSLLTFTLGNSNVAAATLSSAFTDTLPGALTIASPNGLSGTCPGAVTATAGTSIITYANGASIPAGGCTISVNVTGTLGGVYQDVIDASTLNTNQGANQNPALASLTINSPVLTVSSSHTGSFTQNQTGATYTLAVGNAGVGPTAGTLTVTDTLPTGLTYSSASGTGWTCSALGQVVTCTSTTAIAASGTGNPITLLVNVALNAAASLTNTVNMSGGGASNTSTATDPTTVIAGTATKLVYITTPQTVAAGSVSGTLTVQRQDSSSGAVNASSTVTVNLSSNTAGTATYYDTDGTTVITSVTIASGSNSASFKYNDTVSGTPTVTATDNAGVLSAAAQQQTVSSGLATKLVYTTTAQTVAIGAVSGILTVQLQDSSNSAVNAGSAVTVNLSSSTLGAATYYDTDGTTVITSITIASASDSASFKYKDTVPGTPTVTAADNAGVLSAATQQQTVTGMATKLVYTTAAQTVTAGSVSGILTVQLQDSTSSAVNAGSAVTVDLSSNTAGAATYYATDGTTVITSVTIASGSNSASFEYKDTKAGTPTVTASDHASVLSAATQVQTVIAGAANKLGYSIQPVNTIAGAAIPNIKVQIQDANGNLITSATDSVTLAIGTNPAAGTLSGTKTIVAIAGVATFSALTIDNIGSNYTLTASATGLTTATSNNFNITTVTSPPPPIATKLRYSIQPVDTVAGAAIPDIKVQILDQYGNLFSSATDDVTLVIGNNPASGTLSGTSTVAAISGVATFRGLNIDKAASNYTLTASSGSLTNITSDNFRISAGTATKLVYTTLPKIIMAGAVSDTLSVQLQDSFGNAVYAGLNKLTVDLASNTTGKATFYSTDGKTVITKIYVSSIGNSANFKYKDTNIGKPIITASDHANVLTPARQQETVNNGGIVADPSQSSLTPSTASITANGSSTQVLTVQAKDAKGNNISSGGSTVLITKLSGTGTIGSVTDNGNGSYTATVTSPSVKGSGVFVATLEGVAVNSGSGTQTLATVNYVIIAGKANATHSTLTPSTATIIANGSSTQVLTVQAKDVSDNIISIGGATVTITKLSGTGTMGSVTDKGNGSYTATVTSPTVPGTGVFVATLGGAAVNNGGDTQTLATVNYIIGPVATNKSTVIANPTSLPADGASKSIVTVTLRDAYSNSVSGKEISLSAGSGSSIISVLSGTTNNLGVATFSVKDTVAEHVTYTATDTTDSLTLTSIATVSYTAPPAKPGIPTAVAGDGKVDVSWNQNLTQGEPAYYEVTAAPGSATCYVSFPGKVFSSASCSFVGLTNGVPYTFTVKAINDIGSAESNSSNSATPQLIMVGLCGAANRVATLVRPTGYLCKSGTSSLVQSDQGKFSWICAGSGGARSASCSALGETTFSGRSVTLTTPVINHCAIQKVTNVIAPAGGPLGWTLPYDLLDYELANCSASNVTVLLTFSGVVEGMGYWEYASGIWQKLSTSDVTLSGNTATFNIVDNGPYDTDPSVGNIVDQSGPGVLGTVSQAPGVPVSPKVITTDSQATISWSTPSTGGKPIRYIVTSFPDNKTCTALAPLTTCKVAGLTNSTTYKFNVVAENSNGVGALSTISKQTTAYSAPPAGCGLVNGVSTLTAPIVNLCSTGRVASAVTANAGNFAWTCKVGSTVANCSAPGASVPGSTVKTTFELKTPSGCNIQNVGLAQPDITVPIGTTLLNGLVSYRLQNCIAAPVIRLTYSTTIANTSIWQTMHQTWLPMSNPNLKGNTALLNIYYDPYATDPDHLTEPQDNDEDILLGVGTIIGNAGAGTRNLKSLFSTLVLSISIDEILNGESIRLFLSGNKGNAKIDYIAESTGDTYCEVVNLGNSVRLKGSATAKGTCTVWAIKKADTTNNAQISNGITVMVN